MAQDVEKQFPDFVNKDEDFLYNIQSIFNIKNNQILIPNPEYSHQCGKVKVMLKDNSTVELPYERKGDYILVQTDLKNQECYVQGTQDMILSVSK